MHQLVDLPGDARKIVGGGFGFHGQERFAVFAGDLPKAFIDRKIGDGRERDGLTLVVHEGHILELLQVLPVFLAVLHPHFHFLVLGLVAGQVEAAHCVHQGKGHLVGIDPVAGDNLAIHRDADLIGARLPVGLHADHAFEQTHAPLHLFRQFGQFAGIIAVEEHRYRAVLTLGPAAVPLGAELHPGFERDAVAHIFQNFLARHRLVKIDARHAGKAFIYHIIPLLLIRRGQEYPHPSE